MVQLKGNLMPARGLLGEHARVNLQMGADAGARNVLHQPVGTRFDQVSKYINTHCCTSYFCWIIYSQ